MPPAALIVNAVLASEHPWLAARPPLERAKELLAHMNATEKLVLLQGAPDSCTVKGKKLRDPPYDRPPWIAGCTAAIPRLGVPAFHLEDGPSGVSLAATSQGEGSDTRPLHVQQAEARRQPRAGPCQDEMPYAYCLRAAFAQSRPGHRKAQGHAPQLRRQLRRCL